jgi:hypothetical protein
MEDGLTGLSLVEGVPQASDRSAWGGSSARPAGRNRQDRLPIPTSTRIGHIALSMVFSVFVVAAMASSAVAYPGWFRFRAPYTRRRNCRDLPRVGAEARTRG